MLERDQLLDPLLLESLPLVSSPFCTTTSSSEGLSESGTVAMNSNAELKDYPPGGMSSN